MNNNETKIITLESYDEDKIKEAVENRYIIEHNFSCFQIEDLMEYCNTVAIVKLMTEIGTKQIELPTNVDKSFAMEQLIKMHSKQLFGGIFKKSIAPFDGIDSNGCKVSINTSEIYNNILEKIATIQEKSKTAQNYSVFGFKPII